MASRSDKKRAKRPRRSITLTRRGRIFVTVSAVLFIGAYAGGNTQLQLVAALLATMVACAVIFVLVRRLRLDAERTFSPPMVAAGSNATVTITVANLAGTRSAEADWQDRLPWWPWSSDEGTLAPLAPAGLRFSARNTASLSYVVRPPQRGIVEIGPLDVGLGDPFGIARGDASLAGTHRLVVTPQVVVLPDAGLVYGAGDGHARSVQRNSSGNDDDLMTREYRRGDALRRVHWRASARHGELMVRQEEQRARPEVRVLIDTRRSGYDDVIETPVRGATAELDSETFEWSVRMVASVGVHLHRAGFLVSVIESSSPQVASLGDTNQWAANDEAFLSSLASIRLTESEAIPRDLGDAVNGPIFAIVGEPEPETLDWILRQRRPQQRAVVFVPSWAKNAAVEFMNAGWQVIRIRTSDDPADAWAAIAEPAGQS